VDERDRHVAIDFAKLMIALAAVIVSVCMVVLTVWLVTAQQNAKLYLDDNMVCYSQPLAIECHPRTNP